MQEVEQMVAFEDLVSFLHKQPARSREAQPGALGAMRNMFGRKPKDGE